MGAGIPGTGMATLFYVLSVVVMPWRELLRTLQGRSTWAQWWQIGRHLALAVAMVLSTYVTYRYLLRPLVVPDVTLGDAPALLVTVGLFMCYMTLTSLAAAVVPRRVQLPEPKLIALRDRRVAPALSTPPLGFPDRRRAKVG